MMVDLQSRHIAATQKRTDQERYAAQDAAGTFESKYQRWYSESLALLGQLAPDRKLEFEVLYKGDGKRKEIGGHTYTIQDWLNGIRSPTHNYPERKVFDDFAAVAMRFKTQHEIVQATAGRFESTLFDIKQLVQADLFDSELDAARELVKHKFLRGGGAIAGVVLEKHLTQVAANHSVSVRKQHQTISDVNDALKNGSVIEIPVWRFIQRLGDLRNLADHNKQRDPTSEEIVELIDGVDKITKTLF